MDSKTAACSFPGSGSDCQPSLLSIEGAGTRKVGIYNLNTVGASSMVDVNTRGVGRSVADATDNVGVFPNSIAVFGYEV